MARKARHPQCCVRLGSLRRLIGESMNTRISLSVLGVLNVCGAEAKTDIIGELPMKMESLE